MTSEARGSTLGGRLEVLRQVTTQMTVSCDIGEVLGAITRALVTIAEATLARVWLYGSPSVCATCAGQGRDRPSGPADLSLHLAASAGLYTHLDGGHHRIELGQFKIGEIALTRRPHWTDDVESDPLVPDKAW